MFSCMRATTARHVARVLAPEQLGDAAVDEELRLVRVAEDFEPAFARGAREHQRNALSKNVK